MRKGLSIYCDGGARGNPGPAAIGFVVFQNGKLIHKFSKRIGETTNNVAEYKAVIIALGWLNSQDKMLDIRREVNFFLDSQLIVNQLNGKFKIKNSNLQKLIVKVKNLEKKFSKPIDYHYVSRRQNKIADALVNQALNGL